MDAIHRSARVRWIFLVVAIAVLVSAAGAAQARTRQAAASSGLMSAASGSVHGSTSSLLTRTGFAARSLRSAAVVRSSAADPTAYTDPSGDSSTAPDITSVVVSDDANGQLKFYVNLANRLDQLAFSDLVVLVLDADQNAATGTYGFDYRITVTQFDFDLSLEAWNGSEWAAAAASTLSTSLANGQLIITINRSDLGGTNGFNFLFGTSGDAGDSFPELAPDSGVWNYQLGAGVNSPPPPPAAPRPSLRVDHLDVDQARAGRPFGLLMFVTRADTGEPLVGGRVACSARLAGKRLRLKGKARPNPALCEWRIPRNARAKTLTATITVSYRGALVSRTVTRTVGA